MSAKSANQCLIKPRLLECEFEMFCVQESAFAFRQWSNSLIVPHRASHVFIEPEEIACSFVRMHITDYILNSGLQFLPQEMSLTGNRQKCLYTLIV